VRQSIRLVLNTATLLSRMAVTFGIGLYITRLLLELLAPPASRCSPRSAPPARC